jgi:hypothetical protein
LVNKTKKITGGVCTNVDGTTTAVYCKCPPNFSGIYCQNTGPGSLTTTTLSPACSQVSFKISLLI